MKDDSSAIRDAAAAWLGRRDGGLSAAEQAEFARWLAADPRHSAAFERLDLVSRALDRMALLRPAKGAEPRKDLPLLRPRGRPVWLPLALAAAAAVAVAYVGWWRPAHHIIFAQRAMTDVGGLQKVVLPDGSVAELNTDSAIDICFTPAERRVLLVQGEVHFTVAKNHARPFVVEARRVAVRAVGTAFDLRLRPESVEVLVTEGRVRVSDAKQGTSLISSPVSPQAVRTEPAGVAAGQSAVIPLPPNEGAPARAVVAPVTQARISQMLAWENRQISFDPTPLSALVEEFNRYNRHKLVVADPAIASLKVGGSFRVDDYDAFVRLLESSFGIAVERSTDQTVLRGRP